MVSRVDIGLLKNMSMDNTSEKPNITATHQWSLGFSAFIATVLSLSAFFTIVGNSMVLMVIIRHRGMRTRTNLFLVNLAVSDLLVGLLVVPFSITTLIENRWVFGDDFICLFNGWMNIFCVVASFHTLMYISIHKYFSIARPLGNPLTLNYILGMMAAAWIWAGICSTLTVTVLEVKYKNGTSQCGPKYPDSVGAFIVHGIIQLTVIVAPAFILSFCYIRMYMEIRKHSERLRNNSTVEEDVILSQQKKVAITLFIVLTTFVGLVLPYHTYASYTTITKDKEHFPPEINPLAYMFLYLSSMCNPIIYAFRSPAFREGYKEILCQTPNYVISDESDIPSRNKRLSSIISNWRRSSTCSTGRSNSVLDSDLRDLNTRLTQDGQKKKKQKSLFSLLRSTRQSNAQSVIHRNGDIIIMKAGKIVSVLPRGWAREASPFLEQATSAHSKDLVSGLAGPGHVMCGLLYDDNSDRKDRGDGELSGEEGNEQSSGARDDDAAARCEVDKKWQLPAKDLLIFVAPPAVERSKNVEEDVLSVMPLTPRTRELLAKSDLHISQQGRSQQGRRSMTFSCSSDNLSRPPPLLRGRLPSVEFLDPPIHILRSQSSLALMRSKSPRLPECSPRAKDSPESLSQV